MSAESKGGATQQTLYIKQRVCQTQQLIFLIWTFFI